MRMQTPTFQLIKDAASFRRSTEPWLLRNEAAHCLQLGLISGMLAGEWPDNRFMATVVADGEPVLVALRTPPRALILSTCSDSQAATILADEVAALPHEDLPTEVMGPADVVKQFTAAWEAITGTRPELTDRERIYRLEAVSEVTGVPGEAVRADASDRPLLIDWFDRFHREALPGQPFDAEVSVDRWLTGSSRRELWFWMHGGEPVSLAGAGNPTPHGIRLGPVFTPENRRRHGFASALVADLSQRLLDSGRDFCTLFTDLNNPTSNHIYSEIGYRPVVDIHTYRLR